MLKRIVLLLAALAVAVGLAYGVHRYYHDDGSKAFFMRHCVETARSYECEIAWGAREGAAR